MDLSLDSLPVFFLHLKKKSLVIAPFVVSTVYVFVLLLYRVSQNYVNADLKDRIPTVVSSVPREMCVRALNGTVARWLLFVKHDGEQVETVL